MFLRVLILLSLLFLIPFAANASNVSNDFDIEVVPAEGQLNFSEGYFHVDSLPGQTLSLDFRVTNNGEEAINLLIEPVDSYTADQGGILYGTNIGKVGNNHIRVSEMIEVQESVSVAPGDAEIVHFHVIVPDTAHGTILGGVLLSAENMVSNLSMEAMNTGGSNYTFEQEGQRLIAVKVNLSKNPSSRFSANKAKYNDTDNLVTIKIKNGNPAVLENVQGTYKIMNKYGEIVVNGVIKPFAMAPETEIDFPVDLKGKQLESGKYVLLIKGRAAEKEFLAEEKFVIAENQEAGVITQTEEVISSTGRNTVSKTIVIALAAFFLLLPLLMKINKKNEKKAFLDITDKNNI